ncbi:MAG: class I SAM-dependent methyltransferase [Candidatus Moraniibacteriota bacterium]
MENKEYLNNVKAYSKMGEKYLKKIDCLIPPRFFDFLDLLPEGGLALDVGCAGGRDSKRLVEKGFNVVGIDLVDEFLDYAKINVPKAEFSKMDVLELNFSANKFDVILANAILLHLEKENARRALEKLYKVLKPGGKIFIGVKMGQGTSYTTDKLSEERRLFVYYSKAEIEETIRQKGFSIIFLDICDDGGGREDVKWIMIAAEK